MIVATFGIMVNASKLRKKKQSSLKNITVIRFNSTSISAAGTGVTLELLISIKDIILLSYIIC